MRDLEAINYFLSFSHLP